MKRGALLIALGVAVAGAGTPAVAQMLQPQQQAKLDQAREALIAPASTSPYALPLPQITFQSTKDGGEATAVIGVANPNWSFRTTFKSPIGKEADAETTPLSLTGLSKQSTVDLALIKTRLIKKYLDTDLLNFCKSKGINTGCSDQAFTATADREEFLDIAIHPHPIVFSSHIQFGAKEFEFLDKASLQKQKEKRLSLLGGVSIAFLDLPGSVFAMSADVSREYTASKDNPSVCQPLESAVAGALRCDSRVLGGPTVETKGTATVEWRHQIVTNSIPLLGIAIQGHYQVIKNDKPISSVEVPIYFFQKKPGKNENLVLNGGVRSGWSSKDGYVVQVFVGANFKLLGSDIN